MNILTGNRTMFSCRVVLFQDSKGKTKSKPQFEISNAKESANLPKEQTMKKAEDEVDEDHGKEEIFLTWSQVPFYLLKPMKIVLLAYEINAVL